MLPGDWPILPGFFAGFDALALISVLLPLAFVRGRADLSAAAVAAAPWLRWRFSPDFWRAWTDGHGAADSAEAKRTAMTAPQILKTGLGVAAVLLAVDYFEGDGEPLALRAFIVIGGAGLTVGVMAGLAWLVARSTERKWRVRRAGPPEVVFGLEGLLVGHEHTPWRRSGAYLVAAAVSVGPSGREIVFTFDTVAGMSRARVNVLAPLPFNATADLALLRSRLAALLPKARIDF
jgi:hypothetical protein